MPGLWRLSIPERMRVPVAPGKNPDEPRERDPLALEARKDPVSISPCRAEASAQVALLPVTDRRDEQVKQDLLVQRQFRELFT
jgi:hypothetical protein